MARPEKPRVNGTRKEGRGKCHSRRLFNCRMGVEMSTLETFFRFLGERLTDEDNASDVLYAAFRAFDEFRSAVVRMLGLALDWAA